MNFPLSGGLLGPCSSSYYHNDSRVVDMSSDDQSESLCLDSSAFLLSCSVAPDNKGLPGLDYLNAALQVDSQQISLASTSQAPNVPSSSQAVDHALDQMCSGNADGIYSDERASHNEDTVGNTSCVKDKPTQVFPEPLNNDTDSRANDLPSNLSCDSASGKDDRLRLALCTPFPPFLFLPQA